MLVLEASGKASQASVSAARRWRCVIAYYTQNDGVWYYVTDQGERIPAPGGPGSMTQWTGGVAVSSDPEASFNNPFVGMPVAPETTPLVPDEVLPPTVVPDAPPLFADPTPSPYTGDPFPGWDLEEDIPGAELVPDETRPQIGPWTIPWSDPGDSIFGAFADPFVPGDQDTFDDFIPDLGQLATGGFMGLAMVMMVMSTLTGNRR